MFALLAGLAVVFSFSWGEQFTYVEFRLGLTILMFALALSYLGVWEIPAPSFASSKTSQDLGAKEGYIGAFFKGVFATLMATPCSGPLLGYILGATINLSPVQTVAIMMMVGVGMALPYLIIGARPSLVSWLPKPGNWMETLKEFLAFLFLGTVVFFFYGFSDETKVAVFATLIGVWFGCWVIGKVPSWQSIQRRVAAWAVGVSAATAIGMWSFTALDSWRRNHPLATVQRSSFGQFIGRGENRCTGFHRRLVRQLQSQRAIRVEHRTDCGNARRARRGADGGRLVRSRKYGN